MRDIQYIGGAGANCIPTKNYSPHFFTGIYQIIRFVVLVVHFKGEDKKSFGHDQPKSAQGLLSGSQAYEF